MKLSSFTERLAEELDRKTQKLAETDRYLREVTAQGLKFQQGLALQKGNFEIKLQESEALTAQRLEQVVMATDKAMDELKGQIKQVIDMKQRQNIERDLFRADGYVNELLEYLLQFEIPQGDDEADQIARIKLAEQEARSGGVNYLTLFLTSLTQPQQRDLLEELRKLQT